MNRRTASGLVVHSAALAACALAIGLGASSCASVEFTRDTETSGTFTSKAFAVTIVSIDIPRDAVNIARDNASDARLTNMQVKDVRVTPDLGWWDWLLDILGMRWATVTGTWGFTGEEPKGSPDKAPPPTTGS
jgi:hypothetical protein